MAYGDGSFSAEMGGQHKQKLTQGQIRARIAAVLLTIAGSLGFASRGFQRLEEAPPVVDPNLQIHHDNVVAELTQRAVQTEQAKQDNE